MTVPPITDLGNFRVIAEGWYRHFQDASEDERGSYEREAAEILRAYVEGSILR
jgi:hypothetical protein